MNEKCHVGLEGMSVDREKECILGFHMSLTLVIDRSTMQQGSIASNNRVPWRWRIWEIQEWITGYVGGWRKTMDHRPLWVTDFLPKVDSLTQQGPLSSKGTMSG